MTTVTCLRLAGVSDTVNVNAALAVPSLTLTESMETVDGESLSFTVRVAPVNVPVPKVFDRLPVTVVVRLFSSKVLSAAVIVAVSVPVVL